MTILIEGAIYKQTLIRGERRTWNNSGAEVVEHTAIL
jgi:hypothetical protein